MLLEAISSLLVISGVGGAINLYRKAVLGKEKIDNPFATNRMLASKASF